MESRRGRKARRAALSGLAGFAVLLGAWYGLVWQKTSTVRSGLASAQDDVTRLQRQQDAFAAVVNAQAQSRAIRTQLGSLLGNDLRWSALLSSVRSAAPRGVVLTGLSGTLASQSASTGAAASTTAAQLPGPAGAKAIGTLTITGAATSKVAVAAYLDALASLGRVDNPVLSTVALQGELFSFSVRVDITRSALGGRYTPTSTGGH